MIIGYYKTQAQGTEGLGPPPPYHTMRIWQNTRGSGPQACPPTPQPAPPPTSQVWAETNTLRSWSMVFVFNQCSIQVASENLCTICVQFMFNMG